MKDYKEFQFGWLIFIFLIPVQILIAYFYINNIGDRPMDATGYITVNVILVIPYFLFYGMTTRITNEQIVISFGIGLIKKKILLSRVTSVEQVTSPWYYGYGIRFIPNGMMYNIGGSNGVELVFNDTKRIFRIGSKDASRLQREILKRTQGSLTP